MYIKNRFSICILPLIILNLLVLPIFAVTDSMNSSENLLDMSGFSTKFQEEQKGYIYINESDFYKDRNRSYMTGMPSGNFAPEPLKGEELNSYFKSLNLTICTLTNGFNSWNLSFGDFPLETGPECTEDSNCSAGYHCIDNNCIPIPPSSMILDGELNITEISEDGSNRLVCIKSDGYLGTCTASEVYSSGSCTCS